ALLGGEVQVLVAAISSVLEQVKAGKLKAIAVSSDVRTPLLPNVPTIAEALEIANFEAANSDWAGILAPASLPRDVLGKLNKDLVDVITSEEGRKRISAIGYVPVADSPEHFAESIKTQIPQMGALLKSFGVASQSK